MLISRRTSRWSAAKDRRLTILYDRLDRYQKMETAILEGKPYSYTVGPRNKTNYNMSLPDVRKAIAEFEAEIAQLEDEKAGGAGKSRNVIPRDV